MKLNLKMIAAVVIMTLPAMVTTVTTAAPQISGVSKKQQKTDSTIKKASPGKKLQFKKPESWKKKKAIAARPRVQTSLVVDARTGQILHAHNATEKIYPASLAKIMTLYLLFEAVDSGKFSMKDRLYVSDHAAEAPPSKIYLKAGEKISVKDAILALVVKSANDAARVAAENIAGSERKFVQLMNIRAEQLGMRDTLFTNASGWHDPKQVTTALDLAKLSIAVKRDFPKYYHFFANDSFIFQGKRIKGHNRVTANYPGAEGLKTGFTTPAGCNLITAATRGKRSLIGVITGSTSAATRDQKMMSLLDQHFGVVKKAQPVPRGKKKKAVKIASNNNEQE